MLFQFSPFFSYFITYLPMFIYLGFDIVLLIFATFIYKRNSYKYGMYLMISSLIAIISGIISISLNLPYLTIELYDRGLSFFEISIILMIVNLIFLILGVVSAVFLFLAIYKIYQTHKNNRLEKKIN
jgi:hypothetical protein